MADNKSSIKGIIAVVVIIVSVFLIYRYGLKSNPGTPPAKTAFVCTECGHTFEVDTDDTTKLQAENPDKTGKIRCPECERFTAKRAIRCSFCDKAYLPEESLKKYGEKYRCTHCGKALSDK